MSVVNIFNTGDSVHMFTDGGLFADDGSVKYLANKVQICPQLGAVFSHRSTFDWWGALFHKINHSFDDFEDVVERIGPFFRKLLLAQTKSVGERDLYEELWFCGWSSRRQRHEAYGISTVGFTTDEHGFEAPAWQLAFVERNAISPINFISPDIRTGHLVRPVEEIGAAVIEWQRQIPWQTKTATNCCLVGGFVQQTTVREGYISTRLLKSWPDDKGRRVLAHLDAPSSADAAALTDRADDNQLSGIKGLAPAPAAGDAAAAKYLKASGAWVAPPLPLNIKDFGAVGDGTTDDTLAYNAFITALSSNPIRQGYLPKGKYRLTSQPADIATSIQLFGDGGDLTNGTVIFRDYNGTSGKGVLHFIPGSNWSSVRGMAIMAASGTSGGRMLSIVATAADPPPGFMTFENLQISTYGSDTCVNTVYIDGSLRTTAPIGCRDISFKNCHIFGSNGFSLVLNGVIGLSIVGGGVYPAGGTSAGSGAIQITAPGSPFYSQYVAIDVVTCNGLNLTNTNGAQIRSQTIGAVSGVSINAGGGVNQIAVYGTTSGTSSVSSWTNSGVYRPTGYATS